MYLIWFDSNTYKYIYGDVAAYRMQRSNHSKPDCLTILMTFPNGNNELAADIIYELNSTIDEMHLTKV